MAKTPHRMLQADMPLYQRQPHEAVQPFHAFQHYRDLKEGTRSVDAAYRQHRIQCLDRSPEDKVRAPGRWRLWCLEWSWVTRTGAWYDEQDRVKVAVAKARTETWAEAQVEFRESWRVDMVLLYREIFQRIKEMLAFPLEEKISEEESIGTDNVIIHRTVNAPVRWRLGDVPRFVTAMQTLGSMIAGTPNDVPTEEEAIRAWAEREGVPFEQAHSEYRRIVLEMQREASGR